MVQDKAIIMEDQYEVVYDLSIGAIFSNNNSNSNKQISIAPYASYRGADLERPLTHISRPRQYSRMNMTLTIQHI